MAYTGSFLAAAEGGHEGLGLPLLGEQTGWQRKYSLPSGDLSEPGPEQR